MVAGASDTARVGLSRTRLRIAWLLVVAGMPAFTLALVPVRSRTGLEPVLLISLAAVVVVAVVGGIAPGLVGAGVSFLLTNFLHTEPYYTFRVASASQVVALAVFVAVAVLVSVTVDIGARHQAAAEQSRQEASNQARRARDLAETDRVRSAILAAVSHDLRTPLSGIKASVSSLRQRDVEWTSEQRAELLANIEESTDRLNGVVTNLLAMSRIQAGALSVRLQPVVVIEVVGSALLSLGPAAQDVPIDVPEDLPTVTADPDLLERVIANLIANAVRAAPGNVHVTARADHRRLSIDVIDHGPGVPPDLWEEMLEPFRRLDERDGHPGSGLGLAIAGRFCDAIGASLTPSETPGGGLTMTVVMELR